VPCQPALQFSPGVRFSTPGGGPTLWLDLQEEDEEWDEEEEWDEDEDWKDKDEGDEDEDEDEE